jgi:hypothetical protein
LSSIRVLVWIHDFRGFLVPSVIDCCLYGFQSFFSVIHLLTCGNWFLVIV